MTVFLASLLIACSGGAPADAPEKPAPEKEMKKDDHGEHGDHADMGKPMKPAEGAKVMFELPEADAKVKSPVKVVMAVEGMTVQPAGELKEGTGHHHIIVDAKGVPFGEAVPADETHIHFGKGQTETMLELTPGKHKLTLQFADGAHRSYGEQMTASVTVLVEE